MKLLKSVKKHGKTKIKQKTKIVRLCGNKSTKSTKK